MLKKKLARVQDLIASPLSVDFYSRNTLEVARDLLGKILIVRSQPQRPFVHPGDDLTLGRIVETEAYRKNDPAAHCFKGKTPRSSVMFEEPGVAYVYFIYGMYEMLNFVTEPQDCPGAVLIRALEPLFGEHLMLARRKVKSLEGITQGPGRLCRAMGIQMSHNRQSLQGPSLYVCDDGYRPDSISQSGRVGIRLGADLPWRYFISGHPFVSQAPQNVASVMN